MDKRITWTVEPDHDVESLVDKRMTQMVGKRGNKRGLRTRIVNEAPKTREVGETFEAATTERFLAMGSDQASCTDARNLAERIEQATQALRAAFAPAPGRKE